MTFIIASISTKNGSHRFITSPSSYIPKKYFFVFSFNMIWYISTGLRDSFIKLVGNVGLYLELEGATSGG